MRTGQLIVQSVVLVFAFSIVATLASESGDSLKKVRQYLAKNDNASAQIELQNILQDDARNAEARWLLGNLYFDIGNLQGADKEFTWALELGIPEERVIPYLAQVLLSLGDYSRLLELSVEERSTETRAIIQAAQGLAHLMQGQPDVADNLIENAISQNPKSAFAWVTAGRISVLKNTPSEARERASQALELEPDYAPAWSLLGDIENQIGNFDGADSAYTKAVQLSSNDFFHRLKRVYVRIKGQKFAEALKDLDKLEEAAPNHPGVKFAHGLIYFHKNELEAAKRAFEEAIYTAGTYPSANYYLGLIHARQGNPILAKKYLNQMVADDPNNLHGTRLLASLEMQAKNYERVEQLLRRVLSVSPDDLDALNLLANALLMQGKKAEGLGVLSKAAAMRPDSPEAQMRLGAGMLQAGDTELGMEQLQKSLQLDPAMQEAEILIILNALKEKDVNGALKAAKNYQKNNPGIVQPYQLLGNVYLAMGDTEKAKEAFRDALEISKSDPGANNSLASLALLENNFEQASLYFKQVLEGHPEHESTLLRLAELEIMEGDTRAAVEHIKRAIRAAPDSVAPRVALARQYLRQGQLQDVAGQFDSLSEENRRAPSVLGVMAQLHMAQGNYASAESVLKLLISLRPEIAMYHYQLAMVYGELGDVTRTKTELQRSIELAPKYLVARIALARLLLLEKNYQEFENQVTVAREISPDHPDVIAFDYELARLEGDDDKVLESLNRVFNANPTTDSLIQLAFLKHRAGDIDGARKLLESWIKDHPDDNKARSILAELYTRTDKAELAIEQYRSILKNDDKNVSAYNNLAWYLRNSDRKNALKYAEQASQLSPGSAQVMDTLAVVLWKNDDIKRARRTIDRALKIAPEEPTIRFHAAQIRAADGDVIDAKKILERLLKESVDFAERKEAGKLLVQLSQNPN